MYAGTACGGVNDTYRQADIQLVSGDIISGQRFNTYNTASKYMGIFVAAYGAVYENTWVQRSRTFNTSFIPTISGGNIISYEYSTDAKMCIVIFTVDNTNNTIITFGTGTQTEYSTRIFESSRSVQLVVEI